MKERKNILLHLYGDPEAEGDLRSLLRDEELRAEHEALSEAKFSLDHARRQKPDPAAIDRVLAEAAATAATGKPGFRTDRPPVWRNRSLRRVLIPAISMAAAIVFAVGYGLFSVSPLSESGADTLVSEMDERLSPPESLLRPTPLPPATNIQYASTSADPELAWDTAPEMRHLYRTIESIGPESELAWNDRSVPLDRLPDSTPGDERLRRASSRQR